MQTKNKPWLINATIRSLQQIKWITNTFRNWIYTILWHLSLKTWSLYLYNRPMQFRHNQQYISPADCQCISRGKSSIGITITRLGRRQCSGYRSMGNTLQPSSSIKGLYTWFRKSIQIIHHRFFTLIIWTIKLRWTKLFEGNKKINLYFLSF